MNKTDTCSHCGRQLVPGSKFCETCGTPVAPTAGAAVPAPSTAAVPVASVQAPAASTTPQYSSRRLFVAAGVVGMILTCGCIAVGGTGFLLLARPIRRIRARSDHPAGGERARHRLADQPADRPRADQYPALGDSKRSAANLRATYDRPPAVRYTHSGSRRAL